MSASRSKPSNQASQGSRPSIEARRKTSTLHYQTFPTKPPSWRGRQPHSTSSPSQHDAAASDSGDSNHESPLPTKQLIVLAIISLAEQTAFNSISPYLPEMASTFEEVKEGQVGLYVGLIASAFALAQFLTNFFWGWLSDRIGRKPVILASTFMTILCFIAFGFCKTLWQAILVQALMGLVNGNQGVVSTCLGEITDRSNQSRAFTYLPVVYGIGAITGPVLGGLLVFNRNPLNNDEPNSYPYLLPNLFSAALLLIDWIVTMVVMDECLEDAKNLPPLHKRIGNLFAWLWQFTSSSRPTYIRRMMGHHKRDGHQGRLDGVQEEDEGAADVEDPTPVSEFLPRISGPKVSSRDIFTRDTILILVTYFIFQLANISYNSLYPIFGQERPPTGRNLSTKEIGLSLGFAGAVTILFQVGVYGQLREKMGNKITYRVSLAAFVVAFLLMPWVGYKEGNGVGLGNGKVWLWVELGFVLIVKTVASVGGLTSALLLVTNSAPNNNVLGAINGLAQAISAAGRAVGPFVSGALFSAATHVKPKGEALVFGVFGGITFIGFLLSFGIRGEGLEAEGWDSSDEDMYSDEEGDLTGEGDETDENTGLLNRGRP
ncbi:MFS general substrate transporter [Delitschia confertaspora ATCC 74209]|uniref:MFS general substrate transporter n=1 Tax=Delitschia confertaspora ATCC 74209 TaxID=1513339 RepID=A0A9P4JQN5_9PLEO|nr:MFS general substrate transporter [Delitschia confertaspora ATCC 74209]